MRTPPGSGGPPAVIQVFTLVHQVPLIFRSGGDSRDRKDRESPLVAFDPSVLSRLRCQRDETRRVLFVEKESAESIYGRVENSSDQLMMSRR